MQFKTDLTTEFEGKTALVVGGSSGIGLGIADLMQRRGAKVYIIGIADMDKVIEQYDGKLSGFEGDASEADFMRDSLEQVNADNGSIDILVNSAAIHPLGNVVETSPEEWDNCIKVNLRSIYLSCHFAVPSMIEKGSGSIINVASVQGTACSAGVCAYATTKGGIISFTRTLAVDLAPMGIRANTLSPGSIITPMQEYFADMNAKDGQSREDVYAQFAEPVPVGRLGDVEETAELACFLASERSGFCNGGEYIADGGLLGGLRLY